MKIKANLLNKPVNFQLYRTKENGLLVSQYKTKSSTRTVSLPPPLLNILKKYKESVNSRWMFPRQLGRTHLWPRSIFRTQLCLILEHTQCKQIRFHDLRYIFATLAPPNGVDMETVSGMLGHLSAGFTLNTCAYVTTSAQREAAMIMGNLLSGSLQP